MNKALSLLLVLGTLLSLQANAQGRPGHGRPDSRNVVRIVVGDDRDDRDMLRRIHRLEQAVRDLQDQVYYLQAEPVREVICSGNIFLAGPVIGRGVNRTEAMYNTMLDCKQKNGGQFCDEKGIKCE